MKVTSLATRICDMRDYSRATFISLNAGARALFAPLTKNGLLMRAGRSVSLARRTQEPRCRPLRAVLNRSFRGMSKTSTSNRQRLPSPRAPSTSPPLPAFLAATDTLVGQTNGVIERCLQEANCPPVDRSARRAGVHRKLLFKHRTGVYKCIYEMHAAVRSSRPVRRRSSEHFCGGTD